MPQERTASPTGAENAAVRRWEGVGPYYAVFPHSFARDTIEAFCPPGGRVLDPFAGRGTTCYAAASLGREGVGAEIGPLGWLYAATKLAPAPAAAVLGSLARVQASAPRFRTDARAMPPFFRVCYCEAVLSFLLAARSVLDWKGDAADRTLMAILLVYLHGDIGDTLSNQMRRTKSMSPEYSLRWWNDRGMASPPELDPGAMIRGRVAWRYAKGVPGDASGWSPSRVEMGDCREVLPRLAAAGERFDLLLTSPPYLGVTDYAEDQWLRLWLLGHAEAGRREGRQRFRNADAYRALIGDTMRKAAACLRPGAVVYVRTDARRASLDPTVEVLEAVFPRHSMRKVARAFGRPTQTSLYGDRTQKPGEYDLVMVPPGLELPERALSLIGLDGHDRGDPSPSGPSRDSGVARVCVGQALLDQRTDP